MERLELGVLIISIIMIAFALISNLIMYLNDKEIKKMQKEIKELQQLNNLSNSVDNDNNNEGRKDNNKS